ncbi:MAG: hypothetical protein EHM48_08315 [Planctomycetaceae bacterium]|nr:MAG: hypothetical protein EHM48_08315 [Planctomycetaceae bacterium]
MFETLDRMMLAGLGMLNMTREKAEKVFDEYVKRGQADQQQRSGFVKEMLDSAEKARKELQDTIGKQVAASAERLNLASKEDIARLEAKLDKLLKQHTK